MALRNQLFPAAAVCALAISGIAQQTTADGIRAENAVNRPERPYRPGRHPPQGGGPALPGIIPGNLRDFPPFPAGRCAGSP